MREHPAPSSAIASLTPRSLVLTYDDASFGCTDLDEGHSFGSIKVKIRSTLQTTVLCAVVCLIGHASSRQSQRIPQALASRPISLAGTWLFEMDPTDFGERQQWFSRNLQYQLQLPGILQSQNYGDEINTK